MPLYSYLFVAYLIRTATSSDFSSSALVVISIPLTLLSIDVRERMERFCGKGKR